MKKMKKAVAAFFTLVLAGLISHQAQAGLVTIDASDYALGTNLSNVGRGATLSWLTQNSGSFDYNPTRHDVVALPCESPCEGGSAGRGLPVFGFESADPFFRSTWAADIEGYEHCFVSSGDFGCVDDDFSVLEIVFDSPTDRVSIDAAIYIDNATFLAFDSSGNLLGCFWVGGQFCSESFSENPEGYNQTASIYRAQGDIARIVIGAFQGTSVIHEIRYSVPEPETVVLLSLGLAGLGLARRRNVVNSLSG